MNEQKQPSPDLPHRKITRRQFLTMLGGGVAGALGLSPLLQANKGNSTNRIGSYGGGAYGGDKPLAHQQKERV